MRCLLAISTLALMFANYIPKTLPTVSSNENVFATASPSLIRFDDGVSVDEHGDFAVDLFLSERVQTDASKAEKTEFYTSLNERAESYIASLDLSCFEITHFWTMPIITLHYANVPMASVKADLDYLLKDNCCFSFEFAFIARETYEPVRGGSLQNPNPREGDSPERGGIEPPIEPWIDYRDIAYDNYTSTTYNGLGVKVGVAEGDSFCLNHSNFIGTPITIHSSSMITSTPASPTSHCEKVMSVLTGRYGVAPMASVHLLNGDESPYSGFRYLDYFVEWGMDVVNLSLSAPGTQLDPYFDFIVSTYGITIVAACANPLTNNLSQPASAQNVISVCSITANGSIVSGTNIRTNDVVENFRIAAVGQEREVRIYGANQTISGTSFAAPATTGTIALMMQKNPLLKGHPERVMAALALAADRAKVLHNSNSEVSDIFDSTSGNWSWSGVGSLDITESLAIAPLITSSTWSFSSYSTYTMASLYNLQAGDTIRISHAWLRTASENTGIYTNYSLSDFDLKLYNSQNSICISTSKSSTNIENIEYIVPAAGTYTIKTSVYNLVGSQYYFGYSIN